MSTFPSSNSAAPGHIEARLAELGLTLPAPMKPAGAYIPTRRVGDLVFVAGQIPVRDGRVITQGHVPETVTLDVARSCAEQCVLNGLAAVKGEIGNLDLIECVVRVGVFVACDPQFEDHPKVADGASELLARIFGDAGRHVRAAVGAPSLPRGVPVEVEFTFKLRAGA